MSLKQLIYSEDALQRMPSIVKLLQTNKLPSEGLLEIYSNLATLLNGTYNQRKIALCMLRSCIINVIKQGDGTQHTAMLVKWWKGVMNCVKTRYTADNMFRMGCVNAALLIELSEGNSEFQSEMRLHVHQLTSTCISHPCSEGVEVLLTLATHYPTVLGKSYEELRLFCVTHLDTDTAELYSRLTCVGPAGKLGINYTLAWSKMFREVIDNVSAVMCGVLEEITPGGEKSILPRWTYTGSLDHHIRATDEISWLTSVLSSLLTLPISSPLTFPVKHLKTLIEKVVKANTSTLILPSTAQNVYKRSTVSSLTGQLVTVLTQVVSVMTTSSWLLQTSLESLVSYLLQQKQHTPQVLDLLQTLTTHGAYFHTIPTICLLDLITPQSNTVLHVNKKAKNQDFDKMNEEFKPTLDEEIAEKTLVLLSLMVQKSSALLNLDQVKSRCGELLEHRAHFTLPLVKQVYSTSFMVSKQQFDMESVFRLYQCEKGIRPELSKELYDIEPHLHPERCVMRVEKRNKVKEVEVQEEDWDKENEELFDNLPHQTTREEEMKEVEEVNGEGENEVEKVQEKGKESEEEEDDLDMMADSDLLNQIKNDFYKAKNSAPNLNPASAVSVTVAVVSSPAKCQPSKVIVEHQKEPELLDILSSFVDDPRSDSD